MRFLRTEDFTFGNLQKIKARFEHGTVPANPVSNSIFSSEMCFQLVLRRRFYEAAETTAPVGG